MCLLALCFCAAPFEASAKLNARSALLYNASTGRILYSQNPHTSIAPASLTKLMTLHIAMDMIKSGRIKRQNTVRISRYAATTGGSSMGLRRSQRVPFMDLLEGMAIASGNDAATAVAEHCGKGVPAFIRKMNTKAQQLGMKNTVFKTPHGLPAVGQLTTATDMLTLSKNYIKAHRNMLRVHNTTALRFNGNILYNTNGLVKNVRGADGLKTGFVCESGYNIVLTAQRGNTRLIAVLLGAQSRQIRDSEARRLIEAGFSSPKNAKSVAKKLR
ncbi:MAG: D-alanyl-D-alanine carboxypeptidase family protein [Desulfovibrionaceae bacterium]